MRKIRNNRLLVVLSILVAVFCTPEIARSQELQTIMDLRGNWKFSIGDNPEWLSPDYDDSHWEEIFVPGSWEEQGFHGYDGYAWYRKKIKLPEDIRTSGVYLKLGYIDDVDMVFINGHKIGQTGMFPPKYTTAYTANRIYSIPAKDDFFREYLTIAVRVFDEGREGGIIHGDIALVFDPTSIIPDLDLKGEWKFSAKDCYGDPADWNYNDWVEIIVPGTWEDQGFKNYDGIACYVTEFELKGEYIDQQMVLLLGRIDDLEQVYLNGVLIGQAGDFNAETVYLRSNMYQQLRGYYIPSGVLNNTGKNVLSVKVFDLNGFGGIWDGSVGLITQENYIKYWKSRQRAMR